MSNQTTVTEFLLLGFSDVRNLQILHFVAFLTIYLTALVVNSFIIMVVSLDHHLHTPMFFFLVNLSLLDIGYISVAIPKSMANSLQNTRLISYSGCVTQVFLYAVFAAAEIALLTVMAYDRYIAICQPLHYERVMNKEACAQMATSSWIAAIVYSALHTGSSFSSPFCQFNVINQFFCEIPLLLMLTCSDSIYSGVFSLALGVILVVSCFVFIVVSYVQILKTVLRIPSEQGRKKALSTCLPHLTVVSLFVCTGTFARLQTTSAADSDLPLVMGFLYAVVPPIMNPIIYSMKNKEIKAALRKLLVWKLYSKN
ncbi:olfactory receptor 14I1-like [Carettochelys insculpta]|uniref:olfactory receptor 14I1-like n=1 Tax=Carettochelys insculpta TaxID=44489 RepID=UPI003EC01E6B